MADSSPASMIPMIKFITIIIMLYSTSSSLSLAAFLADPVQSPLSPSSSNLCHLDLSSELFGGVNSACSHSLDRSRCCPVLASWLFAAHSHSSLQLGPTTATSSSSSDLLPMLPEEDSQKCVDSLQTSLLARHVILPQPNASCDAVLCFCGIRLHQIRSLTCPAAFTFNVSDHRNSTSSSSSATPTAAVRALESSCRNASYSGCSECLAALSKVKGGNGNHSSGTDRGSRMLDRDCELMGLTWLLARNKTMYIPTVSAVLRALMYSPHPHEAQCSPDQENMPLAVDSLLYENSESSAPSILLRHSLWLFTFTFPVLPLLWLHESWLLLS